jgi:hypothetical protein
MKGEQRRKGKERERVYKFGGFAPANVLTISGVIAEKLANLTGCEKKYLLSGASKMRLTLPNGKKP